VPFWRRRRRQAIEDQAAATSKSAVSRRFAAATETALAELMSRRLDDLDPVALMKRRGGLAEVTGRGAWSFKSVPGCDELLAVAV